MGSAIRFKFKDVPRQAGELARLKVVAGPDDGVIFTLLGPRARIGRGDENDIILTDLKASRVHAEMSNVQSHRWLMKDLNSSNGIIFQGKMVREAPIMIGDTFTIGETTFEFITSDASTKLLIAPPISVNEVQKKITSLFKNTQRADAVRSASKSSRKKVSPLILLGALGVGALFLLPSEPKVKKEALKTNTVVSEGDGNLASYLPQSDVTSNAAETLFKDGMREYFEGNYGRARTQFETVLQISPSHALATLYLENCNTEIKSEIKSHLENGKKAFDAGKLRDARGHFERVLRLLFKDQSNPQFKEAQDQFDKVIKEIRGEHTFS